jgi:thioredoxin reductase
VTDILDALVIGAGPAGLTAGIYLGGSRFSGITTSLKRKGC